MKNTKLYNIVSNSFYLAVLPSLLLLQSTHAADATYDATEASEINANTAAINAIQNVVNQNEVDSDAADANLQTQINNEVGARQTADGDLSTLTTNEKSNLVGAINELDSELATETSNRTTADTAIQNDVDQNEADSDAADTAIRGEFAAEDTAIRGEFAAADRAIRNDFIAADAALQTQINTNHAAIDRNTRGSAMVAALTHTTVLPGMTHALDISAAHFEDETGMALSYSRRISDGVQVNFGTASTTDFEEAVVRAGIGFQW